MSPPNEPTRARSLILPSVATGVLAGQRGGGCEIRTREGLPPTRFPTMLTGVHRGPPPSATWADRDGWVLADAREPRRMRPHLRPAGPAGQLARARSGDDLNQLHLRRDGSAPRGCSTPTAAHTRRR